MRCPRTTVPLFAVLAVLVLGLPRLLVFCDYGAGDAHVAWLHAERACCGDSTAADTAPDDGGAPQALDYTPCQHTAFLHDWLPSGRPVLQLPLLLATGSVVLAALPGEVAGPAGRFAEATGPRRPDPGLLARATIRLQV